MTKREILDCYDRGVRLAKGPVINMTHDGEGNACAVGAVENGQARRRLVWCENYPEWDPNWADLPAQIPAWVHEIAPDGMAPNGGMVRRNGALAPALASVFNVTGSFAEARAYLDKQLTRLVDEGVIEEE